MVHPRKRFGQHWLRSEAILRQIVAAAKISPGDRLLEIGPGTGRLTRKLVAWADALVAVEVDRDLCQLLRREFQDHANFLLVEGDILTLDLSVALQDHPNWQQPNKVVANIPYYITGSILERLLGQIQAPNPNPFESIVLLMQREVAERLCATPGSKAFGALSVRVQYLAQCEWICDVPARAFKPPPKVDSAVVRLMPYSFTPIAHDPTHLATLVKLGFASKRKMLRNNLKSVVERDRLTHFLEELEVNPQSRPEDLSVEQWVLLSNRLQADSIHPEPLV